MIKREDFAKVKFPAQKIRREREDAPGFWRLYWAFGSNLSFSHMRRRCPAAKPLAPIYLKGTQLIFRGVADVTTKRQGQTAGGLWLITPECERSLDQYEGIASRVYIKRYLTVRVNDSDYDAMFYQMATHRGIMPPSEAYLGTIERGYRDFGLDLAYLDDALLRSWDDKEVTANLAERHRRRGSPKLARPYVVNDDFQLSEQDLREAGAV